MRSLTSIKAAGGDNKCSTVSHKPSKLMEKTLYLKRPIGKKFEVSVCSQRDDQNCLKLVVLNQIYCFCD